MTVHFTSDLQPSTGDPAMRAAIFHGVGQPMTLESVEIDQPGPNEVLIRTRAAGLCHSDLHFIEGKYPTPLPVILGHEASGVVEAVGAGVSHVKPGDPVVSCLSVFCGHCEQCLTGRQSLCTDTRVKQPPGQARRLRWQGQHVNQFLNLSAFAEQMLVHENAVVRIPEDVDLGLAALLGCGVLTGYGSVARSAQVEPGSTVAVLGCGGVGLATINAALLAGAERILAIDIDPGKLEMARVFGATDTLDGSEPELARKVIELTGGGVHYAFECIGLKQTAEAAFAMLRPRGLATLVGMIPLGTRIELHGFDFLRERRIQGSMMGSNHFRLDIPRLIGFHRQGRLKLEPLISRRIGLDQINEGFADLQRGGINRTLIEFAA
jgi:S-(hydroxymethyl)glutathione dehydrogenase/alcohol dehydrogenase